MAASRALGPNRDFSPHGLRHTFASLHLALGTNIKGLQNMGGWASAKLLLDLYGHFLPTESTGFADAIGGSKWRQTAPKQRAVAASSRVIPKRRARPKGLLAPREGFEPPTRCLEGSCSIQLSYRGAAGRWFLGWRWPPLADQ